MKEDFKIVARKEIEELPENIRSLFDDGKRVSLSFGVMDVLKDCECTKDVLSTRSGDFITIMLFKFSEYTICIRANSYSKRGRVFDIQDKGVTFKMSPTEVLYHEPAPVATEHVIFVM